MINKQILHKSTNRFSKTIIDYLEGVEQLKPFYKYDFTIEAIEQVIADKLKDNIDRKLLVDVLLKQNKDYLNNSLVKQNIEQLEQTNTYTITTGHQLCLMGGPLYFITKVISIIKTCGVLKEKYTKYNFLPVFWLASEDHGRGEVSSINLFGNQLKWIDDSDMPTGNISSVVIQPLLNELKEILGNSVHANELVQLFTEAYDGKRNLAQATRHYLLKLFGDKGLVIIDGDDKRLKEKLEPLAKVEIETQIGKKLVSKTTEKLENLGYKGQVYPRDINFFQMTEKGRVGVENIDDALPILDNNPEKLSPNVIYRPLYQELILPNLAYIGGPGEMAYWLQLKSLFKHFNVNFPMLILRDSSMFVTKAISNKMEKLNMSVECLFESRLETEKRLLQELATVDLTLEEESKQLIALFDELKSKVEQVDMSLVPAIEGEKTRQLKSFEGFAKRLHKAEKRKQEETLKHLETIHDKLYPNDSLQERHDNFMMFYLHKGKSLFDDYEKAFNPFNKKFVVFLDD